MRDTIADGTPICNKIGIQCLDLIVNSIDLSQFLGIRLLFMLAFICITFLHHVWLVFNDVSLPFRLLPLLRIIKVLVSYCIELAAV